MAARVGRPTKLTPECIAKLREAMSKGCTIALACAHAGIAEVQYHRWIGLADTRRGLYAEVRDMARECMAKITIDAMAQIDRAADVVEGEDGQVIQGDWKAAAWRIDRAERLLRRLDERPDVVRDLEWRRAQWKVYDFDGPAKVRSRKVEFLAALEEHLTVNAACKASRVHRWEFKQWAAEDATFEACVQEAVIVAAYHSEEMLHRGSRTLDKDGKVQTTAIFGILNAKTAEYGLLKQQTYAQNSAKLIKEIGDTLLTDLPADTAAKLRERLQSLVDRAAKLPPGASLR